MSVHAFPHGEGARTVWEGALVLEQLEVCATDVVLQVEGGGEIVLTVRSGTHQDRLMGRVETLVPAKPVQLLKLLLALFTCERHWMFRSDVFLEPSPGAFKDPTVRTRAAVTCVRLLMGFSRNVGVERGSASVLCTTDLDGHIVLS